MDSRRTRLVPGISSVAAPARGDIAVSGKPSYLLAGIPRSVLPDRAWTPAGMSPGHGDTMLEVAFDERRCAMVQMRTRSRCWGLPL